MGQKAGYARSQFTASKIGDRDGVTIRLDARLKITALGKQQDARIVEERAYFRTGEFHMARNRFLTDDSDVEIKAVMEDGKLLVTSHTGPLATTKELPPLKEHLRDALATERLAQPDAKIGDQVTMRQFEPMMLKEMEAVCTLKERKEILFNAVRTPVSVIAVQVADLGVASEVVVNADGIAIEMQMGGAFTLRLESEQQAKDVKAAADVVRLGCIRLDPAPKDVPRLRRLRLRIEGIQDGTELITDARQQWTRQPDGSHLLVSHVPEFDATKAAKLPVDATPFEAELKPTVFVQSDDPRIRKLSAEIVGGERDSYQAAQKLVRWVYQNLKKVGTAALSNAVETLESKQGDCTEHTVLFVALARAAGIPAREVSGVTAIDGGEGLYFHAWPEVWVGQWVTVDPTLNEPIADATHIKFAQGTLEQQFRIVGFLGRLKAKMLDP
jgi:hypothetical protein